MTYIQVLCAIGGLVILGAVATTLDQMRNSAKVESTASRDYELGYSEGYAQGLKDGAGHRHEWTESAGVIRWCSHWGAVAAMREGNTLTSFCEYEKMMESGQDMGRTNTYGNY